MLCEVCASPVTHRSSCVKAAVSDLVASECTVSICANVPKLGNHANPILIHIDFPLAARLLCIILSLVDTKDSAAGSNTCRSWATLPKCHNNDIHLDLPVNSTHGSFPIGESLDLLEILPWHIFA
jgi:hypothetical protein